MMNGQVLKRSRNFINPQMAKNAEMLAITSPNTRCPQASVPMPACSSTHNSFNPARAMAGRPSRNEKRAASSRLKLRNKAAVKVEPERETPGINAPTWARPTIRASRRRIWSMSRRCRQLNSAPASSTAITRHDTPITISPRSGELQVLSSGDSATPKITMGMVARMIATASLNHGSS